MNPSQKCGNEFNKFLHKFQLAKATAACSLNMIYVYVPSIVLCHF